MELQQGLVGGHARFNASTKFLPHRRLIDWNIVIIPRLSSVVTAITIFSGFVWYRTVCGSRRVLGRQRLVDVDAPAGARRTA